MRGSRPPLSTGAPAADRETTTSVVSRIGSPASGAVANSRVQSSCPSGIAMIMQATSRPIGMLPPSPRKIRRLGEVVGQEAEAGPETEKAITASGTAPWIRASVPMPALQTAPTVPAAPS